ncbi:RNAse THREE-like protein 2 isoform 1 [Hibiscus syriacus]|uniref:RNAse THREE-like protein 2 isoform 1 n=1 Tax=Hibiscus syriacus TaxID=106335 RepID=A0A6A2W9W4_HIBSY|nr:RNAse THREE-like protein 2 isoform 1 [Hibiscus syriacus]
MKEPRRLRLVNCAALATCSMLFFLVYATLFQSNDTVFELSENEGGYSLPNSNSNLSSERINVDAVDPQEFLLRRLVRGDDQVEFDSSGFSRHVDVHSQVCVENKPVRICNKGLTVHVPIDHQPQVKRIVKPYAMQQDETAKRVVSPVQILHGNNAAMNPPPACNFTHNVTAVVFSSKGFAGNFFMSSMRLSSLCSSPPAIFDRDLSF